MRVAAAMLFVLSSATLAAQNPVRDRASTLPTTGTGVLRGRVIAAATGDPVRHAVVHISGGGTQIPAALSDEFGRFQFTTLPAAAFTITAAKPGFAKTSITIELGAGRTIDAAPIALPRGSVLTGTMIDDTGEPIANSGVVLLRVNTRDDGSVYQTAVANVYSDDVGAFRFGSLAAGTYTVNSTRLPSGIIMTFPPGTDLSQVPLRLRLPESARYTVQTGEERSGIVIVGAGDRNSVLGPPPPLQRGGAMPPQPVDPRLAITVRGRVTRPGGIPAARAFVQLMPLTPGPPLVTQTDDAGRYELVVANGRADDYRLMVRKPGFALTEFGAPSPDRRGVVLSLKPGDTRDDLDVALIKLFSIVSGRIVDDLGDPVEGALVRVAQLRYADGQRKLVDMPSQSSRTDDLGRYRVSGVRPGQYTLIASVGQVVVTEAAAEFPGYGTSYFPGTTNANEIQLLSVGAAQELNDLDFRLVRQNSYTIGGHASDSNGDPVSGGISLTPRRRSGSIAALQMGARIDRDGGFQFLNVPPGEYVLQVARGMGRNAFSEGEFAYRFIDIVDADVRDLDIQTSPGSTITGRLVFDSAEPPSIERLELSAMPVDLDRTPNGNTARARINADDYTFEIVSIHGPRRIQVTQPPSGWMLKSVVVNGVDVTDEPLLFGRDDQSLEGVEVTLTNRATRLSGRVVELRDALMTDLAVLVFSTRRDQWYLNTRYIRRTVPRADGTFTFDGLPPGEYHVLASYPPDDPGAWRDPDVLEKLALQSTRARFSDGQQIAVELRVR